MNTKSSENGTDAPENSESDPVVVTIDYGGRRNILDRRSFTPRKHQPERRIGGDRRSGFDRRSVLNKKSEEDKERRSNFPFLDDEP